MSQSAKFIFYVRSILFVVVVQVILLLYIFLRVLGMEFFINNYNDLTLIKLTCYCWHIDVLKILTLCLLY